MPLTENFKPSIFSKLKRRLSKFKKLFKTVSILFLLLFLFFGGIVINNKLVKSSNTFLSPGFFISLLFNRGELKEEENRTNFLILGTGGAKHEGPNLTDTIIFLSLDHQNQKNIIISVPRDIWVSSLEQKINASYAIGQAKQKGGGIILARSSVSEIMGLPIHYTVVFNFEVFKEIIDLIGGIDILVDKTFDDNKYPLENGDYEAATVSGEIYKHLHFTKGLVHMDGKTALEFSRSRNSEDKEEGTDFARSKRQQKVILSLKQKILSKEIITNFSTIEKIYQVVIKNIDTDLIPRNFPKLGRLALKFDEKKLNSVILDEGTKEKPGFLENPDPSEYGTWVLIPRSGSWKIFQEYLKKEIEK